jgi:YVTN family beta-propeller protein
VSAPADPRVGTRLAGYRIQALLGRGGVGVVYLAEQARPRRQVALKLLVAEAATDELFRWRFLRESELAAAIDHPHILPIYEAGETDGMPWIAMRYVEGTDLRALLVREGRLAPEQALAIGGQVADALDAAHARGLVHRDVKPANILLAVDRGAVSHAYLADFGLTKRIGSTSGLTAQGQVLGTIDYIAPEQIEGGPVDGRADQYSLGGVLFECLTGVVPFRRGSELAVLWAHVHDPPPRLRDLRPDLPAGLDQAISRALAKAPGDRHTSCGALTTRARAALAVAPAVGGGPDAVRDEVGPAQAGPAAGAGAPATPRLRTRLRAVARRPVAILASLAVAAAMVLTVATVLARESHQSTRPAVQPPQVAPNTAVRIDPTSYDTVAAVGVGTSPVAVASGGGFVWVANGRDGTLSVIDPETNHVQQTLRASGSGPVGQGGPGLVFGGGGLWMVNTVDGTVMRADLDENLTSIAVGPSPSGVAAGKDSVWVACQLDGSRGALVRVDVATGEVVRKVQVGRAPTGLAVAPDGGTVWVTSHAERTIQGIDARTGAVRERVELPLVPDQIAVGEGAVWVTSSGAHAVLRIDPATHRFQTVRVGNGPSGIAVGVGRVWVASAEDGTVSSIDPQTNEVGTVRLGFRPTAVAVDQDAVWVTLAA